MVIKPPLFKNYSKFNCITVRISTFEEKRGVCGGYLHRVSFWSISLTVVANSKTENGMLRLDN